MLVGARRRSKLVPPKRPGVGGWVGGSRGQGGERLNTNKYKKIKLPKNGSIPAKINDSEWESNVFGVKELFGSTPGA